MSIKLNDVAKRAGVSVTTVSRVINHKGYLSATTISKVETAMQELHYRPNAAARSLQGKSLKLIGLVFPNIHNIFYAELIEAIEQNLYVRGYRALLATTEHDADKERDSLSMLLSNQVDGIIYGSHNLTPDDYERIDAPVIAFDRLLTPDTAIVSSDNYQGGLLATETLIRTGAKNIAIFTGSDNTNSPTRLRHAGYAQTMESHGLIPHILQFSPNLTEIRKQAEIKKALQDRKFDAIFCTDDLTALLVKNVAKELAIKIPEDLHLIGFDGTHFIQTYQPDLTTIQQPISDLASLLVDLLLKKISGEEIDLSYLLPVKISLGNL
ncbi:MAG: LacI family DNA-binding transcriptional regulator [Streptococcaceae bacterium]|jgi:LacI family sucrose operon transcriptional repressor|nr:LacI family DNA-binding transcriptional regulator [Streptococcaceae bacterium]